jgi:hypothetical protein
MQAAGQQGIPDGSAYPTCAAPGDQPMKKLLVLGLVAVMATGALAQSGDDNMMGIFFSDTEFVDETTNFPNTFAPFNAYVVLLNGTVNSIAAYEVGMMVSDPSVFVLAVSGPNGWTNFGNNLNHLAGYMTPVPVAENGTILATLNMLYTGVATVEMSMGPATPSSFDDLGPGYANGENVDDLVLCSLTVPTNGDVWGVVATINGDGVVANEAHSLSSVKALFN